MAMFSSRNITLRGVTEENLGLKGKISAPQLDKKRTALKEVGNKVREPLAGIKVDKNIAKVPVKKEVTLLSAKFPIVKQPVNKQPSIQVKETRACRLRVQHSRQSIGRVCIVSEQIPKETVAPKPPLKTRAACSAENLHQSCRPGVLQHEVAKPRESKITCNAAKTSGASKEDHMKIELKTEANSRHHAPSAFSSTLLDCGYVIDIDKDDENDPIMLGMYAKDMYKYLREMEMKFPISSQYLKNSRLTGKMRATLIDWLIDIQIEFDMNPETLFLTVSIIDRFLEKNPSTDRNLLQLVGVTAMFIGCKYEEMMIPDIAELIYVTDNAYTKQEIIQMEITIVKSLDYSFGRPLPIHFLRRYSKADRVAPLSHVMAKYIVEIGVMEYELCHIAPSLLAATALYISLWLTKHKKDVWSDILVQYSSYSVKDILPVVKKLSMVLINTSISKFQAIQKKYSHHKNLQVSAHPALKRLPELFAQI